MSKLHQLPGRKVGMTQVFDEHRNAVPVTVVSCGTWFVTQVKVEEKDGYNALQIGLTRKRYAGQPFNPEWVKHKKQYFEFLKEVRVEHTDGADYQVGQAITLEDVAFENNDNLSVTGRSRGLGFQGVVKRWGFAGGPKTHGSMFHRKPGSIGNMASQGKVLKGKKLPGHAGNRQVTIKNVSVVKVDAERGVIFLKGAVPGKKSSLVYLAKKGA